ncbi:LPXTG cell wall anchor domain-containing protein [Streptomyces xanthochromogenes]
MNQPISRISPISASTRRQHLWARAAVALATVGILSASGLPQLQGTADAATKAMPCEQMFKLKGKPTDPGKLPWANGDAARPEADWDSYGFPNQRQAMDGLTLPDDPAARDKILGKLTLPYKKYAEGTPERVYATYKDYLSRNGNTDTKYGGFGNWLNEAYIEVYGRNPRGEAFHGKVVKDLGLIGPDWICEESLTVTDPDTGKPYTRRFDAVNHRTKEVVEIKSGGNHDSSQAPKDRAFLKDPKYKDYKLRYAFGQQQSQDTARYTESLKKLGGAGRVTTYEHVSTPEAEFKPGKYTAQDTARSIGRGADVVRQSPPNPADMKRQMDRIRAADPEGLRVRGPGGVDFSSLELRYVGKPVKGQGLNYSFSANKVDESSGLGYGGKERAELISDSFFTWLALTPEKFWVNLNPDEPDRVMDKTFGTTDAGRVLLQADLEMKHDYAKDMDPRTGIGKELFAKLAAENIPCTHGVRNWIVPKPAEVREQDGGLYILDAPLKVNSVPQDFKTPQPNGSCDLTEAQHKRVQELMDTMIVPDIEKKVNTDAKYADLRTVYNARVAAEWIRQQDAKSPTDYHAVINSNKVTDWPLRGKNASWTPTQTYKEYVKSFTEGDYSYPCEKAGRPGTCVAGGVDFSKSPKQNVTQAKFTAEHKNLPRTTDISVRAMTDDAENKALLALGGNTAAHTGTGTGGDPTPTPTPTHTGGSGSSTPPATPAPAPSGQGGHRPAPGDQHASGGLANTGTQVATIAGVAVLLVGAGAGLVWLRRRRNGLG